MISLEGIVLLFVMNFAKVVLLQIPLRCECMAKTLVRDWLLL